MTGQVNSNPTPNVAPTKQAPDQLAVDFENTTKRLQRFGALAVAGVVALGGIVEQLAQLPEWSIWFTGAVVVLVVVAAQRHMISRLGAEFSNLKSQHADQSNQLHRLARSVPLVLRKNTTVREVVSQKELIRHDYQYLRSGIGRVLENLKDGLDAYFDATLFRCSVWSQVDPVVVDPADGMRLDSNALYPVWDNSAPSPENRKVKSTDCCVAKYVLRQGKRLPFNTIDELAERDRGIFDEKHLGILRDHGIESGVAIPLRFESGIIGILFVEAHGKQIEIPEFLFPFIECTADCVSAMLQAWAAFEQSFEFVEEPALEKKTRKIIAGSGPRPEGEIDSPEESRADQDASVMEEKK